MISDIEGFEAEIFSEDELALKYCQTIIIEIENTKFASINNQINKILSLNFTMIERYGNVMVFKKTINHI